MSDQLLRRVIDGYVYAGDTDLCVKSCPVCGVTYAIPQTMHKHARDRGEFRILWYCPNGHQLGYGGPSEAERERDEVQRRLTAERELREHTERQLSAQKAATTRARKRAAAAVCPCCNRTFQQLARHMQTKHPDYRPDATP